MKCVRKLWYVCLWAIKFCVFNWWISSFSLKERQNFKMLFKNMHFVGSIWEKGTFVYIFHLQKITTHACVWFDISEKVALLFDIFHLKKITQAWVLLYLRKGSFCLIFFICKTWKSMKVFRFIGSIWEMGPSV